MSSYDDHDDNSIFDIPSTSNSHLLSESLLYSDTGPGGDDLSLSELSIKEPPSSVSSEPFSLLAKPQADPDPATPSGSTDHNDDAQGEAENEGKNQLSPEEVDMKRKAKRQVDEKRREEKLQSDLFILKKLNAGFAMYNEALDESASANERVAAQLKQTDALLNKYIDILSKSEEFSRLILDEQWLGAEADEKQLEQEQKEAQEKTLREAEERMLAEKKERERREYEERERLEKEEKDRIERERQEWLAARGIARGTRASARGTRGPTRAVPNSSRGASSGRLRAPSGTNTRAPQSGSGTKRYTSASTVNASVHPSIRGSSRRT